MARFVDNRRIKRHFRATQKLNTPNLVSHITQRAAGKEPLFLEDKDYVYMIWHLKEVANKYEVNIYAFCLMPNHVHLLLSPRQKNLYDAMRDLFSGYARMFNRKYERKGHLFGGPYRQAVCLDDKYLLTASLYVHLNPVRAGLAIDPLAYRWSSCALYSNDNAPTSFVTPDFILNLLSGDLSETRQRYRRLLEHGGSVKIDEVLEEKEAVERLRIDLTLKMPSLLKLIPNKKLTAVTPSMDLLDMDELDRQIEVMKRRRFPNIPERTRARRYLVEQLIARGYKRKEIADRLGLSRKTVYNIMRTAVMTFMPLAIFLPILSQGRFG
jgi:putative transposase